MIVGITILKLPADITFFGCLLALPAPLFKVSTGTAGFIFPADLLALAFAFYWFSGGIKDSLRNSLPAVVRRLAVFLLLLLPVLTSVFSAMDTEVYRKTNFVLLAHARGAGYLIIFFVFAVYIRRVARPDNVLVLQIVVFSLVLLCGVIQYVAGINLDLWNKIGLIADETGIAGNLGNGFMGLYRGAVGALGVGLLGIASAVLPLRKNGPLLFALVALIDTGIMMSAGSRMGVIIGLIASVLGIWTVTRGMPQVVRGKLLVRCLLGLVVAIGLGLLASRGVVGSRFEQYAEERFGLLQSLATLKDEAIIRDEVKRSLIMDNFEEYPSILLRGVGYGTDTEVSAGRAQLYIDSEIFMVIQSNGGFYFLLYVIFLIILRKRMGKAFRPKELYGRTYVLGSIVVLYSGVLLMWGHFFLLTNGSYHAPIAYWNWALLGGAIGLCVPGKKAVLNQRPFKIIFDRGTTRDSPQLKKGWAGQAIDSKPYRQSDPEGITKDIPRRTCEDTEPASDL